MSDAVELRCFASGGAGLGLGHVARAIEIGREALARGWRVAVALRGDAEAASLVRERLPGARLECWRDADDAGRPAHWALFDTREPIAAELARAGRAGIRRLVLDRVDTRDDADFTVLPNLHGRPLRHPRVAQGGTWVIVPAELRELDGAPVRDRVLVTLGGADPHDLTRTVCDPLAEALRRAGTDAPAAVHVVLGRCFGRREALLARLAELGWRVHVDLGRRELGVLMQHAAFAVCGFGITVYELAWLGVPPLYITHHADDADDAARLERAGLGAAGGVGPAFDPGAFAARLGETALDAGWRARAAERGRALLGDGRGAARIAEVMAAPRAPREEER